LASVVFVDVLALMGALLSNAIRCGLAIALSSSKPAESWLGKPVRLRLELRMLNLRETVARKLHFTRKSGFYTWVLSSSIVIVP
jgi:hypothetical protein